MPPINDILIVTTVILVAFAPMTASFLQCWADRARDNGGGIPHGRSYCDSCGKTLGAIDLVPVLSWIWNRGRARCCGEKLHPTLLYSELLVLLVALWGALVMPLALAIPTVLLASGLQGVVLLTGPQPNVARGFAAALTILGLLVTAFLLDDRLLIHAGATLLGLALWVAARMQKTITPDALFLLAPAGAFTGFAGLALTGFISIPAAIAFQVLKPRLYPKDRRRPVMPAEAVVFGLAAAFWLVWLYFTV
ncbi:MAG: prepilin peptidase [Silicimonas sp.]|nr:prepilin peptidase [Silicimonas sp.]